MAQKKNNKDFNNNTRDMKTYTPSNGCMITCTNNTGDYIEKVDITEIITKASRLAESILMNWDWSQQVELAKEVTILTHELFGGE